MTGLTPNCDYCKELSTLVTGKSIYPHRRDLFSLNFYVCVGCDARVGTHKGTIKPLGRLADKHLRVAKSEAHKHFDELWKSKSMRRNDAYKWLSEKLDIKRSDCHIGIFDVDMCNKVVTCVLEKSNK